MAGSYSGRRSVQTGGSPSDGAGHTPGPAAPGTGSSPGTGGDTYQPNRPVGFYHVFHMQGQESVAAVVFDWSCSGFILLVNAKSFSQSVAS